MRSRKAKLASPENPKNVSRPCLYDDAFVEHLSPGFVFAGLPVPGAKFVQLLLAVRAGTTSEEPGEYGYTELVATLLSRGAGPWDRQQFALECDRRGAALSVFPGRDVVMLELSVLPEDLEWGLSLLETMVSRPRFEEAEIAVAVEEQKEQNAARADEQRTALADLARATLFTPGHAYGRPIPGAVDSPSLTSREQLASFHQRLLLSQAPVALCATGALERDRFSTLMGRIFSPLASDRPPLSVPRPETDLFCASPERFQQLRFPVEQSRVLIGLPGVGRAHPRFLETHWANEIFGGAFLSRLTRAVRSKEGLAYSAGSSLWPAFRGGCLWISLQTDHRNVPKALRTVRVAMEELLADGLPESEVAQFRQFAESSLVFEYDSLSGLASRLMDHLLLGEPWRPEERRRQLRERIERGPLEERLRELLRPELAIIVTSGPKVPKSSPQAFFEAPTRAQRAKHSVPPLSTFQGPSLTENGEVSARLLAQHEGASLLAYPNGVHLLSLPRPELLSVSLQIWTRTGSMDEPVGASGMSHLLEHLMFRGTSRFPDGQFDAILAQKGGVNNAFTSEDFTVYTDYVVPEGLAEALCLEADRFSQLVIEPEVFITEREVVLEERSLRVDASPLGKVYEELQKAAFPSHPYGWPVIGWREDLHGLTAGRIMEHYREAVSPGRLLVVVAGGCDTETARDLVGRTFGAIPSRGDERCWPTLADNEPVPRLQSTDLTFEDRSGYSYLLAAFRFPREGHPDYEAAELLSRLLGHGDSSRLHDVFVREKRLALEVWTSYESQTRDHPLLHLGLATTEDFDFTERKAELGRFMRELPHSITAEELDKVRRGWIAEVAFGTDELEEWALETAGRVMLLPWDQVWTERERVEAVTLERLREVAQRYLAPENGVFAHLRARPDEREKSALSTAGGSH